MTLAAAQRVRVATALCNMVCEASTGIDAGDLERPIWKRAESSTAADIGDLEPDALLGPHPHDRDVTFGREAQMLDRRGCGKPGDYTGSTIKIAPMRHAVEMRANQNGRQASISPRQG